VGEDLVVHIGREHGDISVEDDEGEYEFDLADLGRIAAQACKQAFMQKVREAERDVLYDEYETRVGSLVNGTVQRFDSDNLVINLGRTEAYLPGKSACGARPSRQGTAFARSSSRSGRKAREFASW